MALSKLAGIVLPFSDPPKYRERSRPVLCLLALVTVPGKHAISANFEEFYCLLPRPRRQAGLTGKRVWLVGVLTMLPAVLGRVGHLVSAQ